MHVIQDTGHALSGESSRVSFVNGHVQIRAVAATQSSSPEGSQAVYPCTHAPYDGVTITQAQTSTKVVKSMIENVYKETYRIH